MEWLGLTALKQLIRNLHEELSDELFSGVCPLGNSFFAKRARPLLAATWLVVPIRTMHDVMPTINEFAEGGKQRLKGLRFDA